jgi:RNase P subunit RPR2
MVKTDRDELLRTVSHLSEEDIISLKDDYYSGMKFSAIKKKYNIASYHFSLAKCHYIFPVKLQERYCPNCNKPLFCLAETREDRKNNDGIVFCNSCGHQETIDCFCDYCKSLREEATNKEIEKKRLFLIENIGFNNYIPVSINEISYRDKVLLGTLIQSGIENDLYTLKPFSNSSMQIFPSDDILYSVVKELKKNHLLEFSQHSGMDYFVPDYDKHTFHYYWKEVNYEINIKEFHENNLLAREFLYPQSWMLQFPKNDPTIWDEIVYWESLSLFNYILTFFNIRYEVGKETEDFFWTVTKQLPLAVVYSIIYQSGKNAAAYSKTDRCPKYIAYNSILQNMRTLKDRIISGQYQRWEYNRPEKECPQSIVSQYYFNSILKICDSYWKILPSNFFLEGEI